MKDNKDYVDMFKNSVGIMLSYGEDSSMIPMGVFKINKFLDTSKIPYEEGMSDLNNTVVELVREELEEKQDKSNDRIYIPIKRLFEIYPNDIADSNKEELHADFGIEAYLESLQGLETSVVNYLKENPAGIIKAKFKTLDEVEATYVSNGVVMGNNYSVMPYSLGKLLRKELVKTPHYEDEQVYSRTYHR